MLKLGCTLPNLANICLHISTDAKIYPFTEGDKDLLEKTSRRCCWWSIYRFYTQSSCWWNFYSKVCKHLLIYCWDWCQPTISLLDVSTMPTGLYPRWDFDSETSRLTPRQNKTLSYQIMVMSYFQRLRPDCKIESFCTQGRQKKIDCFSVDGFCSHCNTVFEVTGCFYHFCPCQELRPSLTEDDFRRGSKKRARCIETTQYTKERLQCYWNVGVQLVETVQKNQYC